MHRHLPYTLYSNFEWTLGHIIRKQCIEVNFTDLYMWYQQKNAMEFHDGGKLLESNQKTFMENMSFNKRRT